MPKKELRQEMKTQYAALRGGDLFDFQPAYRQPNPKITRKGLRSRKTQNQGDKRAPALGKGRTSFLRHMHNGKAYDIKDNKPVDGNNEVDEQGNAGGAVNTAPSTYVQTSAAASTDVVTDRKRRVVEQDGNLAKKVRSGNDSTIAGAIITKPIAGLKRKRTTETVDTALGKQVVGKSEGEDAAGDDM